MDESDRRHLHEELFVHLRGSADPFASAVRTTRMPMVITDPRRHDNPIVFCNDAFVGLSGYPRDEILGRNCRFLQGPTSRKEDIATIRAAIERREAVQVDLLNHRKDGTTFWNALLISPVFDGDELTYFFASQFDVTERKRHEEHRLLLHRELDHRVKNTLATVQAVVLQTLKNVSVPQAVAEAVSGRLQALARSHDVLTVEAWASADFAGVIRSALEPLHVRQPGRIDVKGPELRVRPRVATMLSLAMHELGENAARYGSLSNEGGTVAVTWTVHAERLQLEWRERNGPTVEVPAKRGYGLKIAERVLAAEFDGTASVAFEPAGLIYQLDGSVANIGGETRVSAQDAAQRGFGGPK